MSKQKQMMWIRLTRPIFHGSVIALLYQIAYIIRQYTDLIPWLQLRIPIINSTELFIYSIVSIITFFIVGVIKKRYELVSPSPSSTKVFLSVRSQRTAIMTCLWYFGQGFLFQQGISRLIILWIATSTLLILPIIDSIRRSLYIGFMKQFTNSILILYRDSEQAKDILNHIKPPSYYTLQKEVFSWQLSHHIQEDIVLLVWSYTQDELQYIIDHIRLQNKQLYHISDHHFLEDIVYTPSKIGGLRAVRYQASHLEWRASIIKRLCDILLSAIGLILLSPLFVIVAILIKIDSPGNVFYVQDRVGKNNKSFPFIKFRSMYTHLSVGKDYGGAQAEKVYQELINSDNNVRKGELAKIQNDPRVTKIGKLLRATSIDELPNLFSVLQWDMSLIWPRPHLPSEIANYKPRQKRVLSIKPGITGYAQIHGRDELSFDEEATKELEYIQNRSLWLDIYILFATVGVLFGGRGK